MAAELILAPEAEQDLDAAYGWYEQQRIGLGEEFLSCVEACIEGILRSPKHTGSYFSNTGANLFDVFPMPCSLSS
jgi:hypothetical protein